MTIRLSRSDTIVSTGTRPSSQKGYKGSFAGTLLPVAPRQQRNRKAPQQMRGRVHCLLDVSQSNFTKEVLESELPVLVDFWATWCGPCKLMDKTMDWLDKEYDGQLRVVKLETDKSKDIVDTYKVYGLPTLMLVRDGQKVEGSHREGVMTREDVARYLDNFGILSNRAASS